MRFQHIIQALQFEPLLITEEGHAAIVALIEMKLAADPLAAPIAAPSGKPLSLFPEMPKMTIGGGMAEIPIVGPIGKGLGALEKSCGATSVEDIQANLSEAMSRPDVDGILLNFNSPGGTIQGIPELAAEIAEAGKKKPIVSFTDGTMASAAYWLAARTHAIVATPSASVGSIGVLIPWADSSKRAEMMGVKTGVVKNTGGTLKGMGYPGTSYTEEQMAHLQERADDLFGMFKGAVTAGRKHVKPDAMRGQIFFGDKAKAAGLVDHVSGYVEAWGQFQRLGGGSSATFASHETELATLVAQVNTSRDPVARGHMIARLKELRKTTNL